MLTYRRLLPIFLPLIFSILLMGCSAILPRIIPPPTETPTPTPTWTLTPTYTIMPTSTFTPSPSPTITFFPTVTFTQAVLGTPTDTPVPTSYVGMIRPVPEARYRGNFDGGNIVFSSNLEADRIGGLTLTFNCRNQTTTLNLSRASMKLDNSSFTYGLEGMYVFGQFVSSTEAKGVINYEYELDGKKCSYNYVGWTASMK